MFDVAIIGARCAGSALALMLARDGLEVTVVDRAVFPSDTMSGHYIQPAGVSCLRRLGLYEDLVALGAPAQARMTLDFGPVVLTGSPAPMPDGTSEGFAPRRYLFDSMLAEAAVSAGAQLRAGTSFLEPIVDAGGRISGIRTVTPSGGTEDVRARLVVGADGKRSRFARSIGAGQYGGSPATSCCYYTYFEGLVVEHARLFVRDGLFCVAMPCADGLTFLAVAWPRERFSEVRRDIEASYVEAVARIPWLSERVAAARRVERYVGTGDLDAFFRPAAGDGWALVGDSGHHKDPITAQGMTDALLDAELLSKAIVHGLGGDMPISVSLAEYGRRRDGRAMPMHRVTADLARLIPPPEEQLAAMADMATSPAAVAQFLGVMAGSVPVEDVFGAPQPVSASAA